MKWLILFCTLSTCVQAAQSAPAYDPTDLLLHVRRKVMASMDRLPSYLCTENIRRTEFLPKARVGEGSCGYLSSLKKNPNWKVVPGKSDRLQFDVMFSKNGERYSRVGENRFSDSELADLAKNGVTSTGPFGTFLSGIFAGDAASFTYDGETNWKGRKVAQFSFRVTLDKGGYSVRNRIAEKPYGEDVQQATVLYDGTFLVDPETSDLVRLTVHADELPKRLRVCGIATTLDYGSVQLNKSRFLLPLNSRLRVVNNDGSEAEDDTAFSGCREFVGESRLRFDQPPEPSTLSAAKPAPEGAAVTAPAQQTELLQKVRTNVMATVQRLPRYLCTETVNRSTFLPETRFVKPSCDQMAGLETKSSSKVLESQSDRLRLDVAVFSGEELYSWVGENRFRDRGLAELVKNGLISSGAFGTFLSGIFAGNAARFSYQGDFTFDGRALPEFAFRIARDKSTYDIGDRKFHAVVPYSGSFLVDPETSEPVRLTIDADELPPQLNTCEVSTSLEYRSMHLNNSEFLLPKTVRLRVVNDDGSQSDNSVAFSNCHEFRGESKLRFDDPADSGQAPTPSQISGPLVLPANLHFKLALISPIQTGTAAAGDKIEARLATPIREQRGDHAGKVLIPAGAAVTGRIVRLARFYFPESKLIIAIKLETIETGGVRQPFDARLLTMVHELVSNPGRLGGLFTPQQLGSFDSMFAHDDPSISFLEYEGVTTNFVVRRGLKLDGITTTPQPH